MGGNPSVTDEVVAQGPGIGLASSIGFWAQERAMAVSADLSADIASDFDRESTAEDAVWDTLGQGGSGDDGNA